MKNLLTLTLLIVSLNICNAQDFPYQTFQSSKVTYLGLDYTNAKFVDDLAFTNAEDIQARFLKTWNGMLISEPDKYDFKKFTAKSTAIIDLSIMNERNSKIDPTQLVQSEFFDLKQEDIPQIARTIDFGELDGLAAFFIVGTYNKNASLSSYFLVLYDIDQVEILFMKKYTQKPGGFGVKNYWASTYYKVLLQLEKDMEKKWSKGKN